MKKQIEEPRTYGIVSPQEKRGGPGSAGQSGDTQGLPGAAEADSQSVRELVEEGQYSEAETLLGVEEAPDPDVAELHINESPNQDAPETDARERTDPHREVSSKKSRGTQSHRVGSSAPVPRLDLELRFPGEVNIVTSA